jgi:predicted phosphodiesterase
LVGQQKKSQISSKSKQSYTKKLKGYSTALKTGNKGTILVISDLHIPYHHPDSFAFLSKLKSRYAWDTIINIGDEMDWHSVNVSHVINPDLPSPADELEIGRHWIGKLHKMFPIMILLESNHGSMVLRRAMAKGMSKFFIKDYNEILQVSNTWTWKESHWEVTPMGRVYFAHQVSKNIVKAVQMMSASVVQGHYHTQSNIEYVGNDFHLNWGMSTGCLVNKSSLAMAYMKVNMAKPILSCGAIINGVPYIIPMLLKKDGSWDGQIYI